MLTEEGLTGDVFIEFLKSIIEGLDCPIFLILDGHPVHHSIKVRKSVESTEGMLELYYPPDIRRS